MDALFEDPRLVQVYDHLEGGRPDLDVYSAMVDEFGAHQVLDVGCGTGEFALRLARRGIRVIGLDPASASLAAARAKPDAELVSWIHGDARELPAVQVDLAVMTGNVAQAIADPDDWHATLHHLRGAVAPGGRLVFETRRPERRAWEEWTREQTFQKVEIDGVGRVEHWTELTAVELPLVTFRGTYVFADGLVLTSHSTLRFRTREEVEAQLAESGWRVLDVRDALDRPGREVVFVASPSETLE